MAKTLNDYKKEFAELQKLTRVAVEEIDSLEHNLDTFRAHIVEGFNALGARVAELRQQGATGATIDAYLGDPLTKKMVAELGQRRDTAKVAAARADVLNKQVKPPILNRMETLREGLAAEITTREKKFSSKALGLNQSVKELKPLQAAIDKYCKGGSPEFTALFNFKGTYSAGQFDRLYTSLLTEQLNKSVKEVRAAEKQAQALHQMNDKVMKQALTRTAGHVKVVLAQAKAGATAHLAKDIQALAAAKTAGATAFEQLTKVVAPYEKTMKDKKFLVLLSHSPDEDMIRKNTKRLFELKAAAAEENEQLQARRFVN